MSPCEPTSAGRTHPLDFPTHSWVPPAGDGAVSPGTQPDHRHGLEIRCWRDLGEVVFNKALCDLIKFIFIARLNLI